MLQQAEAAAARPWTFWGAPFPLANGAIIQSHMEQLVTDTVIALAVHVRRILDNRAIRTKFTLDEPFRHLSPAHGLAKVATLRGALSRIVHATEFEVGFERLSDNTAKILGGAIGVIYLRTKTDHREDTLIDLFARASCFVHRALSMLQPAGVNRPDSPGGSES